MQKEENNRKANHIRHILKKNLCGRRKRYKDLARTAGWRKVPLLVWLWRKAGSS